MSIYTKKCLHVLGFTRERNNFINSWNSCSRSRFLRASRLHQTTAQLSYNQKMWESYNKKDTVIYKILGLFKTERCKEDTGRYILFTANFVIVFMRCGLRLCWRAVEIYILYYTKIVEVMIISFMTMYDFLSQRKSNCKEYFHKTNYSISCNFI